MEMRRFLDASKTSIVVFVSLIFIGTAEYSDCVGKEMKVLLLLSELMFFVSITTYIVTFLKVICDYFRSNSERKKEFELKMKKEEKKLNNN